MQPGSRDRAKVIHEAAEAIARVTGMRASSIVLDECLGEVGPLIVDDTQFLARLRRCPSKAGSVRIPLRVLETGQTIYVERRRLEALIRKGHSVSKAFRMLVEDQVCPRCLERCEYRTGPSLCGRCEDLAIADLLAVSESL